MNTRTVNHNFKKHQKVLDSYRYTTVDGVSNKGFAQFMVKAMKHYAKSLEK